jgi:transcriptional regulator with XRE-family HTH domain
MTEFSERLKQLRDAQGVSQQELADYLKLNKQTISGYERGVRRPSGEGARNLYEKIADFFNVDISYLMGLSDVSIKISDPCQDNLGMPKDIAFKYSQLDLNGKEAVHTTIENEYDKYNKKVSDYKRVLSLDKITTLEDARILLSDAAAFGGNATDEQLLKMANAVLKGSKPKKK